MEILKCPECRDAGVETVFQHEVPVVARRALSLHRFNKHNIRSVAAQKEADRKARLMATPGGSPGSNRKKPLGPEPPKGTKEHTAWSKHKWALSNPDKVKAQRDRARARNRGITLPTVPALNDQEVAQRNRLQQSAWWQVEKESQLVRIKLDACPCCGAQFVAIPKR